MSAVDVTQTVGRDWWIQRTGPSGKQRYPQRIRVGKLDAPRVYVPVRTCRNDAQPYGDADGAFSCSSCGYRLESYGRSYMNEAGLITDFCYCPYCGAEVENANYW